MIESTDLTLIYDRGAQAAHGLIGFSESFAAGDVTGLLGPNGAGKTTAMRILTLGLQPESGELRWNGIPIIGASEGDRTRYRRDFGYLPEYVSLHMRLTGWEYGCFIGDLYGVAPGDRDARLSSLFQRFNLSADRDRYVTEYSQGMLKSLALSCTVLHQPRMLFLDEPTNGLDPLAMLELESFVRDRAAAGVAVVIASHNLHFISKVCDRTIFIHGGVVRHRSKTGAGVDAAAALSELESLYRSVAQVTGEGS